MRHFICMAVLLFSSVNGCREEPPLAKTIDDPNPYLYTQVLGVEKIDDGVYRVEIWKKLDDGQLLVRLRNSATITDRHSFHGEAALVFYNGGTAKVILTPQQRYANLFEHTEYVGMVRKDKADYHYLGTLAEEL